MGLAIFREPGVFWSESRDFLVEKEAENNLMIGVLLRMIQGKHSANHEPYLACEYDGDRVTAAAVRTAPFPLIITEMTENTVSALVRSLGERQEPINGVVGPSEAAKLFARKHCAAHSGLEYQVEKSMTVYYLDDLEDPPSCPGKLRLARGEDLDLLVQWTKKFFEEIASDDPRDSKKQTKVAIDEKSLFVWEDGEPVSMAAIVRETENGKAIAMVYTPARKRRRGYGAACVAGVCRLILDSGSDFCVLFADDTNPTSNNLYRKIGFRPISGWTHFLIG